MMKVQSDLVERVRSRCVEEGDCWIWQGARAGCAMNPQISINGEKLYVRRVVYEAISGEPVPKNRGVSTSCRTGCCVNPDHLVMTTTRARAVTAGAEGKYSGVVRAAKIAANKRALLSPLTPEKVADIRFGGGTHQEAAERNGVSRWTVGAIRRGERWKDYSSPFAGLVS